MSKRILVTSRPPISQGNDDLPPRVEKPDELSPAAKADPGLRFGYTFGKGFGALVWIAAIFAVVAAVAYLVTG